VLGEGWSPSFVDGALDYWATLVMEPERVTSTVEEITGTPGRTFREWAIDHDGDCRWVHTDGTSFHRRLIPKRRL
jgi:hypothetical protein